MKAKSRNLEGIFFNSYGFYGLDFKNGIITETLFCGEVSEEILMPYIISDLVKRSKCILHETNNNVHPPWVTDQNGKIINYPISEVDSELTHTILFKHFLGYVIYSAINISKGTIAISLSKEGCTTDLFRQGKLTAKRFKKPLDVKKERNIIENRANLLSTSKSEKRKFKFMEIITQEKINTLVYDRKSTDFWKIEKNGIVIIRHLLLAFLQRSGFYRNSLTGNPMQIINNVATESSRQEISEFVFSYINSLPALLKHDSEHIAREELVEQMMKGLSTYFGNDMISMLKSVKLERHIDTRTECNLFFLDTIVIITKDNIRLKEYCDLDKPISVQQIIKRNFTEVKDDLSGKSVIERFCLNVSANDENRLKSLKSIIGYLLDTYKDPLNPFSVVFVDQEISEYLEANGGKGKTLLCQIIMNCRNCMIYDGRTQNSNSRFPFSGYNNQDLIIIEDANPMFDFDLWIGRISAGISIEKKYENSFFLNYKQSPKFIINSNYIPQGSGGYSEERRKKVVEVSPYYNDKISPLSEFGHRLFDDWETNEWAKFDAFSINCIQLYLHEGVIDPPKINILARTIIEKTNLDFYYYMQNGIANSKTSWNKKDDLNEFKKTFPDNKHLTQNMFTKWIKFYLRKHEINCNEYPKDYRTEIRID